MERGKFGLYRNGKPGVIKQIQGHQLDSNLQTKSYIADFFHINLGFY